jgi:hypothetical protein
VLSTDFAHRAHAAKLGALNGYGVLLISGQRESRRNDITGYAVSGA